MKQLSDNENYLIDTTNKAIAELVYPKWDLQKAYNYYNGVMDAEQFRYLEENYGIGNPTSVEFIPLIKKHIDALVGEYLGMPIIPKVSCKDSDTITSIFREKELEISKGVFEFLQSKLRSSVVQYLNGGQSDSDQCIQKQLDSLIQDLDSGFVSKYEIAAQNVVEYIMQSRTTDMTTKLRMLFLDLLITGYMFFRAKPSVNGNDVEIEVLSPLNTFFDKNPESPYIKDSFRVVVRKWLTRTQILNTYGKDLSKEDREKIEEQWRDQFDTSYYYVRSFNKSNGEPASDGINAGKEIVPGYPTGPYNTYNYKLIPVYEVEWIETDKDFVMQRYETVRIGEDIYILKGKNENVIRTKDNPTYCTLSVNGIYFVNRGSTPYSLVLACASLQDKYNILHFYRDNLIASSGTSGDWIDISLIPSALGVNFSEKIQKWIAYKKSGLALLDTSQEGRMTSGQPMNTTFTGYDDTIKVQAIQAIQLAIDSVEQTTSSITGVFRERLNGIQQKDAVTNVQVSVNNSFTITKQYYQEMDLAVVELLVDSLNQGKIVFKHGLKGSIILGDKYQKVFVALPENFTATDYDIRVLTSTDIIKDMESIKAVIPDFIKSGSLDPSIIFEALTSKSLTDLKQKVRKAIKQQKQENDQVQQLSQQTQQLQQQLQEAQKQLQQAEQKIQSLDEAKISLEKEKLKMSNELEWFKAQTDRQFKNVSADNDTKRTQIEFQQLYDGNPYNDKVRQ